MKTTRVISTISFNTEDFLKGKLNDLVDSDILSYWVYIKHLPDKDSGKEHFHVYMQPSKAVDLTALRKQFKEPDPENENPRGCLTIDKSEWQNWCWYVLHDWAYLMSKGQTRNVHYKTSDLVCNDDDELTLLLSQLKPTRDMLQWIVIKQALDEPKKDVVKVLQDNYITPFDWERMTRAVELARNSKWNEENIKKYKDENGFRRAIDNDNPFTENETETVRNKTDRDGSPE